MRIALVSPTFPPYSCGVGDHGACVAEALHALGHEVTVITAGQPAREHAAIGVRQVRKPWSREGFTAIVREVGRFHPELILVQFTPYLFKDAGWDPALAFPKFLAELKRASRAGLAVIAHELHYPVGLSPRGLLVGVPQWVQFRRVLGAADHVYFTNELFARQFARVAPGKTSWVPVGSNLTGLAASAWGESPEVPGFPAGHGLWRHPVRLLHFGGAHPTHLLSHVFAALAEARRLLGAERVGLGLLGIRPGQLPGPLPAGAHALGYLSVGAAIRALEQSTLVLAPFMDGVSTRRGSVMGALALGRPVITNRGRSSDPSVPWEKLCLLAPAEDVAAFARAVGAVLEHPEGLDEQGRRGRSEFEARFSWKAVAEGLLKPWEPRA